MFNPSRLFHPRLMRTLHTHHNTRGYIQHKNPPTQDASGEEIVTYTPDRLLIGLQAQVDQDTSGAEVRRPDQTIVEFAYSIALQGYYPQIKVTDQFVINDDVHDILNVAHDSEHAHTTLTTEIVSHG